jgi:predicted nuclease with TOPRIM domain
MTIDISVLMQVVQVLVILTGMVGFIWRIKISIASVEQRLEYIDNRLEALTSTVKERDIELSKFMVQQARMDERYTDLEDKVKTLFHKYDSLTKRRGRAP